MGYLLIVQLMQKETEGLTCDNEYTSQNALSDTENQFIIRYFKDARYFSSGNIVSQWQLYEPYCL